VIGVQTSPELPEAGERRNCLAAVVVVGVILAVLIGVTLWAAARSAERSRREFEQRQADRRTEFFNRVKAGEDGSRMSIMDPLLLEMLAGDAECAANLTTLQFSMVDVSGTPAAAAKSLRNVREIGFYDCGGADDLLRALEGSPAVEEIFFEMAITSEMIPSMSTFSNLKKVTIYGYRVSAEQEALLRQTLSGVEIVIDDG
jgi:hypothetical protein